MARYQLLHGALESGVRDEAAGRMVITIQGGTVIAAGDDCEEVVRAAKVWLHDNPFGSLVLTDGGQLAERFKLDAVQSRVSELAERAAMAEWMGISHVALLSMFILASFWADYGVVGYLSVPVVNGLYQLLSRTGSRNYVEALWSAFFVNLFWLWFAAGG